MRVVGFKPIIKKKLGHFGNGVSAIGDSYVSTNFSDNREKPEADCYVQFNIYNPYYNYNRAVQPQAFQYILDQHKPFLVCEEGAFRQFPEYKRFGWYSYKNGIGIFDNGDIDSNRWQQFKKDTGISIPDWNSPGENILIMAQIEKDSALIEMYEAGYTSFVEFVIEQIYTLRKYTDRPIVVRPHPRAVYSFDTAINTLHNIKNVSVSKNFSYDTENSLNGGSGLQTDLDSAYCVVTYSSNSGVEAVCQGIPTFALSSTSSIYDIAHTDLSLIENLNYNIDIEKWCNQIAYSVWSPSELGSGETWTHFKEIYYAKIKK
jgi:hypothetical protein